MNILNKELNQNTINNLAKLLIKHGFTFKKYNKLLMLLQNIQNGFLMARILIFSLQLLNALTFLMRSFATMPTRNYSLKCRTNNVYFT